MSFRRDRRGFIFSLDATLAMLVVLIMMAGVARMAGPELTYGQHGYLRLERYANDALEVMQLNGSLDNVTVLVGRDNLPLGREIARGNLRVILPEEIQFKLVVGYERLIVYPNASSAWDNVFDDLDEIAVATRIWIQIPWENFLPDEIIRVLAWLHGDEDEKFMDDIDNDQGWEVTKVFADPPFRNEILREDNENNLYYNVIFLPDARINFDNPTVEKLITFAEQGGMLVTGGETLKNNDIGSGETVDNLLWHIHGVTGWGDPHNIGGEENAYKYMTIIDASHSITSGFEVGDNVGYAANDYEQEIYESAPDARVLAEHKFDPVGKVDHPVPWPGIIVHEAPYVIDGRTFQGDAVLFNKKFAHSVEDPDPTKQPKDEVKWFELIRKAIGYGFRVRFEPIILYVWRGTEVS